MYTQSLFVAWLCLYLNSKNFCEWIFLIPCLCSIHNPSVWSSIHDANIQNIYWNQCIGSMIWCENLNKSYITTNIKSYRALFKWIIRQRKDKKLILFFFKYMVSWFSILNLCDLCCMLHAETDMMIRPFILILIFFLVDEKSIWSFFFLVSFWKCFHIRLFCTYLTLSPLDNVHRRVVALSTISRIRPKSYGTMPQTLYLICLIMGHHCFSLDSKKNVVQKSSYCSLVFLMVGLNDSNERQASKFVCFLPVLRLYDF